MDMRRGRCATAALEMADSRRTPQQQTLSAMFTRSALQNTPSTGSSTGAAGAAATSGIQRRPGSLLAENAENLRRERETQLRIRKNAALQREERLQRGGMQHNAPSQGSFAGAEGASGAAVASSSSTRAAEHRQQDRPIGRSVSSVRTGDSDLDDLDLDMLDELERTATAHGKEAQSEPAASVHGQGPAPAGSGSAAGAAAPTASAPELAAAQQRLEMAGRRKAEVDKLLAEKKQERDALHKSHTKDGGGGGSGRWCKQDQSRKDRLNREIALLERGVLPSEHQAASTASRAELLSSARNSSLSHHAGAASAPAGRVHVDGNVADDDDDVQDQEFGNYYTVTPQQQAFNTEETASFLKQASSRSRSYIDPPDVAKSGCDSTKIGLGRLYVHAPHKFLGFQLTPCPFGCGWKAVDEEMVTSRGPCPARRVFALELDEWVSGELLCCKKCQEHKSKLQEDVSELEHDGNASPDEISRAKKAVSDARCFYRSYNPVSLQLYAERYPGYVASLPYIITNRRTALTRPLANMILRRLSGGGGNPNDLAEELSEYKGEALARLQAEVDNNAFGCSSCCVSAGL